MRVQDRRRSTGYQFLVAFTDTSLASKLERPDDTLCSAVNVASWEDELGMMMGALCAAMPHSVERATAMIVGPPLLNTWTQYLCWTSCVSWCTVGIASRSTGLHESISRIVSSFQISICGRPLVNVAPTPRFCGSLREDLRTMCQDTLWRRSKTHHILSAL